MNRSSDHQRHPDIVQISFACPNEDKNETSDKLFGPGRTLGKAFDFGGRHIDAFLSQTAERMGYGPRVISKRIRRRRDIVVRSTDSGGEKSEFRSQLLASIEKKIEKDVKRLLRYVNSRVLSTQKQAIDQILDLSVDDYDVRALLKSRGATKIISDSVQIYSEFRFSDFDDLLLSSSRKALVSLSDAEINTLLQEWITVWSRDHWVDQEETAKPLWNKIAPYLDVPETAFLVMRALRRTITLPPRSLMLRYVLSSLRASPNYFEWEECEVAFHEIIPYIDCLPKEIQSSVAGWILRYAGRMPGVFKSKRFRQLSMNVIDMSPYIFGIVHRLRDAFALAVISDGENDGQTPSLDVLKTMYTSPVLEPLLSSLVCPIERLLCCFVIDHRYFDEYTPTHAESRMYNEVACYIDSSNHTLRAKAWSYVNYFLALDIYRCDMMLEALSLTSFAITDDFSSFKKTEREQCVPGEFTWSETAYRHLSTNNNQIHLRDDFGHSCSCDVIIEDELKYPYDWVLDMRVERGTAFYSAGFYPLVAGYDADGKCAYVAIIYFHTPNCTGCGIRAAYWEDMRSAITEGRKPEDMRIELCCPHQTSLVIPEWFVVLVLRYAPDAYFKVRGIDEEGSDSTGPFSWRHSRDHQSDRTKYRARVIMTEEAMTDGKTQDGEGHTPRDQGKAETDLMEDMDYHLCGEGNDMESDSKSSMVGLLSCDETGLILN